MITITQEVPIDVASVLNKAMIMTSYEMFSYLIADTVSRCDEPDILANLIVSRMNEYIESNNSRK